MPLPRSRAETRCARAREEYNRDPSTFATDFTLQEATILHVLRAGEAALDMTQHIARREHVGVPVATPRPSTPIFRGLCVREFNPPGLSHMQAATIASHRFGYSETSLRQIQDDPRAWVLDQFKRPAPFDASGLLDGAQAWALSRDVLRAALQLPGNDKESATPAPEVMVLRRDLRQANMAGLRRRWQHISTTSTPVAERWVQFWANHFCVAATRATVAGLIWPHEYEAVRPHAFGSFQALARAALLHPAMLLYLDNAQSIGPDSRAGRRREKGLNENLARELLELHTLGVNGGYTQDDVTQTARLLTGWTMRPDTPGATGFVEALHQPGSKLVLGKTYPEGPKALDLLLEDLTAHPACARFVALKLVRHFVTDDPPQALVDAVAARFRATRGDLPATAQALFTHELAWGSSHAAKFKRPEELVLSAYRMLKLPVAAIEQDALAVQNMGQALGRAPSPQGWPDRTEDWLSPDALHKRVLWAARFAKTHRELVDARALARLAWGDDLSLATAQHIERAESAEQSLALALASPEFQRR